MKSNKILSIAASAAIGLAGLSVASCSLDLENPNEMGAQGFWKSEAEFAGNITAVMNQFRGYASNIFLNAGELRSGIYYTGTLDGSSPNNLNFVNNIFTAQSPGFSNYASWYGLIANCNEFIYRANETSVLPDNAKSYMLGMIHGIRAYAYFQIHKMYGTGPLRTDPDVIMGNYDPVTLYKRQCKVSEMVSFIDSEIKASLDNFAAAAGYSNSTFNASKGYLYWNKAATEMLAGEFNLWAGKVSTYAQDNEVYDYQAEPSRIATAKQYFTNVVNNYGYQMMPTFEDAFAVSKKASNTENIFAFYYGLDEASQSAAWAYMWTASTGTAQGNFWSLYGKDGVTPSTTAYRLGQFEGASNDLWVQNAFGVCRYSYLNSVWFAFDAEDTRRDEMFQPAWIINDQEKELGVQSIPDFDTNTHYLGGAFAWKFKGQLNTAGKLVCTNNIAVYRLPYAYLALAEIANYEGSNSDVEKYINLVRARAYGENFAGNEFVSNGNFTDNEVAILNESTREFLMEGHRWWDLRRMTAVKNGSETDHLVFRPEACMANSIKNITPYMTENGLNEDAAKENPIQLNKIVIDPANKHLVLWPLDNTLLGSDTTLVQTPGY